MKKVVLIVAGGAGQRMGSDIPKQFLTLKKLPILMHTVKAFHSFDSGMDIRLVLPDDQMETWEQFCKEYSFNIPCELVRGGETRFHSVKNGLEGLADKRLVAVHDGVRPLVSQDTIKRCFEEAERSGAVVPVIDVKESLRKIDQADSVAVDRSAYRLVQTPGIFHSEILKDAYTLEYDEAFTDDASVVEAAGYKIFLTEGNPENIKITSPSDLLIAEALIG